MNKLILAAAALAVLAVPAMAENAKTGARTFTPFGYHGQSYGSSASAGTVFEPAGQALSVSTWSDALAEPFVDSRRGRADKK